MAEDRKVEPDHTAIASLPLPHPIVSTAADMAGRPSYTLWLQLQYQQQLAALQSTTAAAAAHEASQPPQKAPSSQVSSPPSSFHPHPALEVPSDPYAQSANLYNQLHQQALGLPPQWWLPAVSGAEPAGVGSPGQETLGRPPPMMAIPAGANRDHYAILAEQSIAHAAEHERQQQQIAARLQAIAAGVGFSPAEMEAGPRLPLLRDPAVGFGRGTARSPGEILCKHMHHWNRSCNAVIVVQHSQGMHDSGPCVDCAGDPSHHVQVTHQYKCTGCVEPRQYHRYANEGWLASGHSQQVCTYPVMAVPARLDYSLAITRYG